MSATVSMRAWLLPRKVKQGMWTSGWSFSEASHTAVFSSLTQTRPMLPTVMLYWDVQNHNSRCLGSSLGSRRLPKEQKHLGGQAATEMMFLKL